MSGIIIVFFSQLQVIIITYGSDKCKNNSSNKINYSNDQMRKMIVNLGSKNRKYNDNTSTQLTRLHHSLLLIIVNTPENDLSNVDGKYNMRKLCTYSVKSSSTLFFYSIHCMY